MVILERLARVMPWVVGCLAVLVVISVVADAARTIPPSYQSRSEPEYTPAS